MANLNVSIRNDSLRKTAAFRKQSTIFQPKSGRNICSTSSFKRLNASESPFKRKERMSSVCMVSTPNKTLLGDYQVRLLEKRFEIPNMIIEPGSCKATQKEARNKVKVLEMMGFKDLIEPEPRMFTISTNEEVKLRPSHFNVSELWGVNMKKEFIHKAGYDDALKHLKKRTELDQIKSNCYMSKPDKPRIMDENILRKTIFQSQKRESLSKGSSVISLRSTHSISSVPRSPMASFRAVSSSPDNQLTTFETLKLENIISQCEELSNQNNLLKLQNNKMRRKSTHDFLDLRMIATRKSARFELTSRGNLTSRADLIRLKAL